MKLRLRKRNRKKKKNNYLKNMKLLHSVDFLAMAVIEKDSLRLESLHVCLMELSFQFSVYF